MAGKVDPEHGIQKRVPVDRRSRSVCGPTLSQTCRSQRLVQRHVYVAINLKHVKKTLRLTHVVIIPKRMSPVIIMMSRPVGGRDCSQSDNVTAPSDSVYKLNLTEHSSKIHIQNTDQSKNILHEMSVSNKNYNLLH